MLVFVGRSKLEVAEDSSARLAWVRKVRSRSVCQRDQQREERPRGMTQARAREAHGTIGGLRLRWRSVVSSEGSGVAGEGRTCHTLKDMAEENNMEEEE